jgi:hypothetical protein
MIGGLGTPIGPAIGGRIIGAPIGGTSGLASGAPIGMMGRRTRPPPAIARIEGPA